MSTLSPMTALSLHHALTRTYDAPSPYMPKHLRVPEAAPGQYRPREADVRALDALVELMAHPAGTPNPVLMCEHCGMGKGAPLWNDFPHEVCPCDAFVVEANGAGECNDPTCCRPMPLRSLTQAEIDEWN